MVLKLADAIVDDDDDDEKGAKLLTAPPELSLSKVWTNVGLVIGGNTPNSSSKHRYPYYGRLGELRISRDVRYTKPFEPAEVLSVDQSTTALYRFEKSLAPQVNDIADRSPPLTLQPLNSE